MSSNHRGAFIRLLLFSLSLFFSNRNLAQAGVEHGADDPFGPIQNSYYRLALSSLISAGNTSEGAAGMDRYIECINTIARVYRIEGNYSGALDLLVGRPVSKDFNPGNQLTMSDFSLNMQGVIDNLRKKTNTDLLQSQLYYNLSKIYNQAGNPLQALSYQLKSRELLKNMHPFNKEEYTKASLYTGEEYILMEQEDSAIKICDQTEKGLSDSKDSSNYVGYLNLKAIILHQQNKSPEAINLYEKIFTRLKIRNEKHPQYYEMALRLGHLYSQTKQYEKADSVFRRNFQVLYKLQYKSIIIQQMIEGLCENLIYMNKTEEASTRLISYSHWMFHEAYINSAGMGEDDEFHYVGRLDRIFDLLNTIIYNSKTVNKQLLFDVLFMELQHKRFIFLNRADLLRQTKAYWNTDIPLPYRAMRKTKELIAQQYSLPYNRRYLDIDSLEQLSEKLERKISANGFFLSPEDNRKGEVMAMLTDGRTANIEFVRFNYKSSDTHKDSAVYAAFIFAQSLSSADFVPLCSEKQLIRLLKDENGNPVDEDQLTDKLYDSKSKYSDELYKLIWAPISPYLKNISSINYSPAGLLNSLAIGAIYNGKDYLTNVYTLHFFSSLLEAGTEKSEYEKPAAITVWGNIDYDAASYANDPHTSLHEPELYPSAMKGNYQIKDADTSLFPSLGNDEITRLKTICNNNHIRFSSCEVSHATEDSFKKQAAGIKDVLHISTHGFYFHYDEKKAKELLPGNFIASNKNPLFRSGLVFSGVNRYWKNGIPDSSHEDGVLTAYEIEQLDLHNIQLVTLSACETGLGDSTYNEGNLGLQWGFKMAGAHYVLASLWQISPHCSFSAINC